MCSRVSQTIVCGLFLALGVTSSIMVGDELRRARNEAGLTQEQLASRAKLHPTYIGLLERNKRSPSLDVFLRLCAAMKIPPVTLLRRIVTGRHKTAGK